MPARLLAEGSEFAGVNIGAFPRIALAKNRRALVRIYSIADQVARNAPPPSDLTSSDFMGSVLRLVQATADDGDIDNLYFIHSLDNAVKAITKAVADGGGSDSVKTLLGLATGRETVVAVPAFAQQQIALGALLLSAGIGLKSFVYGASEIVVADLKGESIAEKFVEVLKLVPRGTAAEEVEVELSDDESDSDSDGGGLTGTDLGRKRSREREMLATVSKVIAAAGGEDKKEPVDLVVISETKLNISTPEQMYFLKNNERVKTVTVHKMARTASASYSNFPLVPHPIGRGGKSKRIEVCILLDGNVASERVVRTKMKSETTTFAHSSLRSSKRNHFLFIVRSACRYRSYN